MPCPSLPRKSASFRRLYCPAGGLKKRIPKRTPNNPNHDLGTPRLFCGPPSNCSVFGVTVRNVTERFPPRCQLKPDVAQQSGKKTRQSDTCRCQEGDGKSTCGQIGKDCRTQSRMTPPDSE